MSDAVFLLPPQGQERRIERSGHATLCRFVKRTLDAGRTAVCVTTDAEHAAHIRSLLPLFFSERPEEQLKPLWEQVILDFPPVLKKNSRESVAKTIAALYSLTKPTPRCLLASLESLLLCHLPLDYFGTRTLDLSPTQEYAPELVLEQAIDWGYVRVPMVGEVGDIALRGDILDIFPPGYAKPLRLEFFGDTLEEIRLFDAETQRSKQNISDATILPMTPSGLSGAEKETAVARLDRLQAEGRLSENAHYSLKKALDGGPSLILPPLLFANASLFEDWLDPGAVFFLPNEVELVTELVHEREELKAVLEDENASFLQPAQLVLRKTQRPQPWPKFSRLVFTEELIGANIEGEVWQERRIDSFEALFPEKEARDRPWQALLSALKVWTSKYRQVLLCFTSHKGRNKFLKLCEQEPFSFKQGYAEGETGLFALVAPFRKGVELLWDGSLILGEDILFPRAKKPARHASSFRGLRSFDGIREGDLLVHRDYGIGRFGGLHLLTVNSVENDFLLIEYAGRDKLYVPADNLSLIQRYKSDGADPPLDRLGGTGWKSSRDKARKAIEKIAADLVEMYAYRKVAKGFSYGPLNDLYHEFEATFDYEETPDQARAIQDVLDDMAKDTPMDRLVCGDVGFGKTEVAMRAAFRCALEGRQVAMLCPTTVLAEQHYQTFRSRLTGFPVTVGLLSRFVSRTKQKQVLDAAARGSLDILVGTHRLISNDVQLPNLGLLILDEEQRFGVRHKEKLKSLRKNVDVLTLTATPIPRTLQLSMSGIRDLSLIETPPENRKAVTTLTTERDDAFLRTVIEEELARKGQVFWVYNRVQGLEKVADYVRTLLPGARVASAHGQLSESALESVMYSFWHGEIDVLVCTSIVESGLDFPNVNTIIIDQAHMFGLGQLYQLRGRVGRSDRQAYCYLIVPGGTLPPVAAERLGILQNLDYLGAGFQLAMEDLRLRGAGNILGEVQSGHMSRIGLDLYLEMLEDTVARLKGEPVLHETDCEVNLGVGAHIPVSYMDDSRDRMHFYKALTSAEGHAAREVIALEMADRFGSMPVEVHNFIAVLGFKECLRALQVARADVYPDRVSLHWADGQTSVSPESIMRLVTQVAGAKVTPPATLTLPMETDRSFGEALFDLETILGRLNEKTSPVA
ncbi:MAG: transcription-repair coupling factor [Desulfovibrio sp.]|nr:transcription-repair coupling factor [Desulfovibrio sp.]